MSRSYKQPWYTDPSKSYMKRIHARAMRRKIKQQLSDFVHYKEDYDVGPLLPLAHEVTNQYDVCDFKLFWDVPKNRRK